MRHSLKTLEDFRKVYPESTDIQDPELQAIEAGQKLFKVRTTPYYWELSQGNASLRRILLPQIAELEKGVQEEFDPLNERNNNPVPRIIHRYPDRVLFLPT